MRKLVLFVVLSTALFACKKKTEDSVNNPAPAPEDLEMKRITSHDWIMYKVTLGGLNMWDAGVIQSCQKDDSYKFYKDSVLMTYENANVCSGNSDSTESSWQFFDGRKKLVGTILGSTDTADILLLDDLNLNVQVDYSGSPAVIYFKKN